jgi:hypothetical protein
MSTNATVSLPGQQRGTAGQICQRRRHHAVPQQVQVIDAVRTRDHPSCQQGTFRPAFTPHRWPIRTMLVHQSSQNVQRRGADCPAT